LPEEKNDTVYRDAVAVRAITASLEISQPPNRGSFANETEKEAFLKQFQQEREEVEQVKKRNII